MVFSRSAAILTRPRPRAAIAGPLRAGQSVPPGGGFMAGPSDGFFRGIVKTVGGRLAEGLPELGKRQLAARALGTEAKLADIAVTLGLLDARKLEELGGLEQGDRREHRGAERPAAAASARLAPVAAPAAAPSSGRVKTPSAPRTEAPSTTGSS